MEGKTVFEVFGIENKETKVSNLFAYYINTSKEFRDLLCELAKIDLISTDSKIKIDREFYFTLEGYDSKNNYIDILIRIGDDIENPERIICIENKIYADEGYKQTERYQKGMEKLYPDAKKDYIFITKNNSYVNLSSMNFNHVRYMDVIERVHKSKKLMSLAYMKDFCEFYYDRDYRFYREIEEDNTIPNGNAFIDYFVWKANNDSKYSDLYVCSGVSAKNSSHRYLQISKQSWLIKKTDISDEMSIHLEGDNMKLALHFETSPYIPMKKLTTETQIKYIKLRDLLRTKLKGISIDNEVKVSEPDKRGTLTLVNFDINVSNNLKNTLEKIIKIINEIDNIIASVFSKS